MSLYSKIESLERRLRAHYNTDLSTPENRRKANIYNLWFDHAFLRTFWTNAFEVAPGVFRSNQPTHKRFVKLKARGIRSVINLRGESGSAHYLVEKESCDQLGLKLINVPLHARAAISREKLLEVIEALKTTERPFLMHCKSGADRAGLASAIFRMVVEGKPVGEAKKMLSVRFAHVKWSSAGVLDFILERFEEDSQKKDVDFETWVRTVYDPVEITEAYRNRRK